MNLKDMQESVKIVSTRFHGIKPQMAFILGSGWNNLTEQTEICASIPYAEIPLWEPSRVQGHQGMLRWAKFKGQDFLFFDGRHHWYEGLGWFPIALPIFITKALGSSRLILTNSAGGINATFSPGDIMVIEDHINAMGTNPLIGPHDPFWGNRFPDMSDVYHPELRRLLNAAGIKIGLKLKRGIYAAVTGPSYETPAEIKALGVLGADAVGMSTVPEAIMAHAAGLAVAGVSLISNSAAGICPGRLTHEDVLNQGHAQAKPLQALIIAFLEECLHNTDTLK